MLVGQKSEIACCHSGSFGNRGVFGRDSDNNVAHDSEAGGAALVGAELTAASPSNNPERNTMPITRILAAKLTGVLLSVRVMRATRNIAENPRAALRS